MKERPILFSGPMVRAIVERRKTQTRRVVSMPRGFSGNRPITMDGELCLRVTATMASGEQEEFMACPYGVAGDQLWVRETFFPVHAWKHAPLFAAVEPDWIYRADSEHWRKSEIIGCHKWTPSVFMPRKASRISLEVVSVRVERLQAITEADAKAEGVTPLRYSCTLSNGGTMDIGANPFTDEPPLLGMELSVGSFMREKKAIVTAVVPHYREAYAALWDEINGEGVWAKNPWVWVIEFTRIA